MKVHIHEMAAREFDDAILWYDTQLEGLEDRFKKATLQQIEKIKKSPSWFLKETEEIYKAYIRNFHTKFSTQFLRMDWLYGLSRIYIEGPGTGSPE